MSATPAVRGRSFFWKVFFFCLILYLFVQVKIILRQSRKFVSSSKTISEYLPEKEHNFTNPYILDSDS